MSQRPTPPPLSLEERRAKLAALNWKEDCIDELTLQLFVYEFHGIRVPNHIRDVVLCQLKP